MIQILAKTKREMYSPDNTYSAEAKLEEIDKLLAKAPNQNEVVNLQFERARVLLEYGDEAQSVAIYELLVKLNLPLPPDMKNELFMALGTAYLCLAERNNCVMAHNAESCIMPVQGAGYTKTRPQPGKPPRHMSLVPNKLFKNLGGQKSADATASSRLGNLQKGHGVSFADLDNDGDQDIHADMGGALRGDTYPNSLYLNPGEPTNNWICLKLEGVQTNRAAIGAKITLKFKENGQPRMVYREVNSGGSFGCSPLRREIGIGKATVIDEIVVQCPVSGKTTVLKNVKPNQFFKLREDKDELEPMTVPKLVFKKRDGSIPMCAPVKAK